MARSFAMQTTVVLALALALSGSTPAAPIVLFQDVTNTADSGAGSLRSAILSANASPSNPTEIRFNIPGDGPFTIRPDTALPDITATVFILGDSQPGTTTAPLIELDGGLAGGAVSGLTIRSDGSLVRGLAVGNWNISGIVILNASRVVVEGCRLGTDIAGVEARPNAASGVAILSAQECRIGGPEAGEGNLISGNGDHGVSIVGSPGDHVIQGNLIGTDITGTAAIPNTLTGVFINDSPMTLIGGSEPGEGNMISGNLSDGVRISGGILNTEIHGNLIGTNASGQLAIGNLGNGVLLLSGGNQVGNESEFGGNLIAHNGESGMEIQVTDNIVVGNTISDNASSGVKIRASDNVFIGNLIAHNGESGVEIQASDNIVIGNTISDNTSSGVAIVGGQGSFISRNEILLNGGLGIDLGQDGVTVNPTVVRNTQPNDAQRYPEITRAEFTLAGIVFEGQLRDTPNTPIAIEIFASPVCDPSGFGEGWVHFTDITVMTDASGEGTFALESQLSSFSLDRFFTAIATGPDGSTSEFSPCVLAVNSVPSAHEIVVFLLGLIPDPGDLDVNADGVVNAADVVARLNALPVEIP